MIHKNNNRLRYLQNLFLQVLLEGHREISEEEAGERKSILGIDRLCLPCFVACVAPDYSHIKNKDKDDTILNCEKYVASFFERHGIECCTLTNSFNNIQTILHANDSIQNDDLLIQLHDKILMDLGLEQFIGIGSVVDEYGKIAVSAAEATDMLAYKYQYAEKGVINIANIVRFQYNSNYGNNDMFDRVIGCFRDGNLPRMVVRMDELIREIRYRPNVSRTSIKRTMIELTVHILRIASNAKVDVDQVLEGEDPYRWIMMQEETPPITSWFISLASNLLAEMKKNQASQREKLIQAACEYITKNISDPDLGLQSLSEWVGLSPSYLSQLFKTETGLGVNNYITKMRVELAKKLLKTTQMKVEEIALQLGYTRANYFGIVFKKETGMTPGLYRRTAHREDMKKVSEA